MPLTPHSTRPYAILFLCTGNSARSILAESLLNSLGAGRFRAYSAGSHPKGRVHPLALETLRAAGRPTESLRSKGWDEFAAPGAPVVDAVITVCDQAAGEMCPVWPGRPVRAHWGLPDPAGADVAEAGRAEAFRRTLAALERALGMLLEMPWERMDSEARRTALQDLAKPISDPGAESGTAASTGFDCAGARRHGRG
jgi:arsenate reductase